MRLRKAAEYRAVLVRSSVTILSILKSLARSYGQIVELSGVQFLTDAPSLDVSRYRAHASRRACIRSRSSGVPECHE